MISQTSSLMRRRARPLLAAIVSLVAAMAFGAVVGSAISRAEPDGRPNLKNPFDASRSVQ